MCQRLNTVPESKGWLRGKALGVETWVVGSRLCYAEVLEMVGVDILGMIWKERIDARTWSFGVGNHAGILTENPFTTTESLNKRPLLRSLKKKQYDVFTICTNSLLISQGGVIQTPVSLRRSRYDRQTLQHHYCHSRSSSTTIKCQP